MRLGDVLEVLAILLLAASAYLWKGPAPALAVLAVGTFYLAQCYDHVAIRPLGHRKSDEGVMP